VGAAFLRTPEVTISDHLAVRQKNNRRVNLGGSWYGSKLQLPTDHDIEVLFRLNHVRPDFESRVLVRIEEPTVHVYSEDEMVLHEFAQAVSLRDNSHIKKIYRPSSADNLELLKQGFTISQRTTEYPFKVFVREGRYNALCKQQIMNYLNSIPELVKLPKHFTDSMNKQYDSVWNCYFYTKDKSICTMLSLINPNFIRTIEEYHTVANPAK
jgi:hypothetical protein